MEIAAHEATRIGLVAGANATDMGAQAELILFNRNVQGATITIIPNDVEAVAPGDFIRVEITAPCASNSLLGDILFQGRTLDAAVEMMKEF